MYNRIDRKWPGISAPKRHFFGRWHCNVSNNSDIGRSTTRNRGAKSRRGGRRRGRRRSGGGRRGGRGKREGKKRGGEAKRGRRVGGIVRDKIDNGLHVDGD
jgi:hypothetical protein